MQVILKDGKKTRLLIARKGQSLRSFAKEIGVSQGYLSQILALKKKPSANIAYKISKGLKVDIEDIFLIKMNDISIVGEVENC